MDPLVASITTLLSFGVILLNVATVLLAVVLLCRKQAWTRKMLDFAAKYAFPISFILVLASMLGSLFYSEIAKFDPCKWCWWQRIFMYPLVPVLWLAMIKKQTKVIRDYVLALSGVGLVLAGYHYYLQFFAVNPGSCAAVGAYQVSCAKRLFVEFGYVTVPMMALAVFAFIIVLMLINRHGDRD